MYSVPNVLHAAPAKPLAARIINVVSKLPTNRCSTANVAYKPSPISANRRMPYCWRNLKASRLAVTLTIA